MVIRKSNVSVYLHIAGSILFLLLPVIFSPDLFRPHLMINRFGFKLELTVSVLLLGVFYLQYFYLVPYFFMAGSKLGFWLISLGLLIVVWVIPSPEHLISAMPANWCAMPITRSIRQNKRAAIALYNRSRASFDHFASKNGHMVHKCAGVYLRGHFSDFIQSDHSACFALICFSLSSSLIVGPFGFRSFKIFVM